MDFITTKNKMYSYINFRQFPNNTNLSPDEDYCQRGHQNEDRVSREVRVSVTENVHFLLALELGARHILDYHLGSINLYDRRRDMNYALSTVELVDGEFLHTFAASHVAGTEPYQPISRRDSQAKVNNHTDNNQNLFGH